MVNMELDNFEDISPQEKEKVTCYYKLIKRLPDIEYEAKCSECDGFPVKEGCMLYTTKDHIENFIQRMREPGFPSHELPEFDFPI